LISDVKDDTRVKKIDSVIIQKIKSAMCVPLWNNGEIMGVFYADRIYLRKPFSEEELELLTLIANVAAVKIEDCRERARRRKAEEIRKQLDLAARIQKDFLPRESPAFKGFDIAGHNIPTYQVGGDYFDYIPLESNQLGVAIADVSGKGPPAALHMVAFRTRLEVEAVPGYDIQEMTSTLNDYVHRKTDINRFISFFFCELDNLTGVLKYVNAGHNLPIVIKRKGKTETLGSCGLCLGMFASQKYEMRSVNLGRGDMAVLYTDGITECRNKDNKEFGEQRFVSAIKKNSKCSAQKMLEKVFEEVALFTKGVDQMDDMTLVIIKRVA
jgi:sigma-B regulation protein RsbU (phosphoserine phosphatase)